MTCVAPLTFWTLGNSLTSLMTLGVALQMTTTFPLRPKSLINVVPLKPKSSLSTQC